MKNLSISKYVLTTVVVLLAACTENTVKPVIPQSFSQLEMKLGTIESVVALYGEPEKKSAAGSAATKYHYNFFHVTAYNRTGRLNTIIIFSKDYVDVNGISIGDSKSALLRVIPRNNLKTDDLSLYFGDMKNNIVYWMKNDRVTKIVLAAQLG